MVNEKTPLLKSKESIPSVEFALGSSSTGKDEITPTVTLKELFRFMDRTDVILAVLGTLGAICYGALAPGQFIVMGEATDDFVEFVRCQYANCSDAPDLEETMSKVAGWYVGLGLANLLFAWMALGLWGLTAERQVHKMRLALFRNIICQEIGWFDTHDSGELSSRLTSDLSKIADGIGPKFGRLMFSLVAFLSSYALGFSYVWQMTLVMMAVLPVMAVCGAGLARVIAVATAMELSAYAKAGNVAEQSLSSIRTVAAYGGEERQVKQYNVYLNEACASGEKKALGTGVTMCIFHFVLFCNYAVSLWYGVKMVRDQDANSGDVMSVFFMVMLGSTMIGQSAPCAEAFATARSAAAGIFEIIDKKSGIDGTSNEGLKPATTKGDVQFSNITFAYPSRPTVQVLNNFSLTVPSGKRVALVGESGCGKSTVVKLIQRFYDPKSGTVTLDGEDIKNLNVRRLRNFIGVVNQEPVLFATTIAENIAYGNEGVGQKEIEEAAKMANAHDFIIQFPQGYNTLCGERGIQMSGGQKQRISIARALVRHPKILLLDEATSALDNESESVVQEALDRAGEGRTTIIIAHRLSTIRNADIIVAVKDGQVMETGSHDELIALNGVYKTLIRLQKAYNADDTAQQDEEDENNDLVNSAEFDKDGAFKLGSFSTSGTASNISKTIKTEKDELIKPISFFQILKANFPEWPFLLVGSIGASLYGSVPFLYGICLGGIFDSLAHDPNIEEERQIMKDDSEKFAVYFVTIGIGTGIGMFFQIWLFGRSGERLTRRLRGQAFKAFLRQDIAYFDEPTHNTGALSSRLSTEVASVQGAAGIQLGFVMASIVSVIGCLIVSFINTWRLTLVLLAFSPIMIFAGLYYVDLLGGNNRDIKEEDAGQAATETFANIQTVASLGREEEFFERYRTATAKPYRLAKKTVHISGLTTGSTMCVINISFAAAFRYGGTLITDGDITLKEMMTAIFTFISGAMIIGISSSMTPDYSKAKVAAQRIFALLDLVPGIDGDSDKGLRPDSCSGEIQLNNVRFNYPKRRNVKVLRNMNMTVKPGETVALVGVSGCGKSTATSLIERFYDTNSGSVTIDKNDVKILNIKWLRNQIGIVSQEPVLFDQTIRENIAYGNPEDVSKKEIEDAARAANIHDFIQSLPDGYETMVGDKGSLISGGQKQRIAIARALIRDPKILLLDEATSALDSESEKIVQQALDNASIGRTTLIIAHRLSTIQHADAIVVIRKGRVVERGTHQQLLALKGIYYALHKIQGVSAE